MTANVSDAPRGTPATAVVREPIDAPAEPVRRRKDGEHPSLKALPDYPVR